MKIIINESQLMLIVNKNVISEERIGYISTDRGYCDIYVNPMSIKKFDQYCRGIITSNGDLFVVDDGYHILHNTLADYLRMKGIYLPHRLYSDSTVVPVQRGGLSNTFYLGEGYTVSELSNHDIKHKITMILEKAKLKNPHFNFVPKSIDDSYST